MEDRERLALSLQRVRTACSAAELPVREMVRHERLALSRPVWKTGLLAFDTNGALVKVVLPAGVAPTLSGYRPPVLLLN